ncbi:hypothetical protein [Pedobacter deserti]|uniref:hypothetical protein n=1 Tax=Pedobacter deserti TaxID=2817382 RepID=UPI00210DEBD0|nr:hypothetical protein [Pedobacter sp. SYSU D00382]
MKNDRKDEELQIKHIEEDEEIRSGARQTDQLEKMNENAQNDGTSDEDQAGIPPITEVNDGD